MNDEKAFINSIATLDFIQLSDVCIALFRENQQLKIEQATNDRINNESFLQYNKLLNEKEKLLNENKELKVLLEKEINKYELRAKSTFGRKTEGLLSLIESAENKPTEFEDESQVEDHENSNLFTTEKVIDFCNQKQRKAAKVKVTSTNKKKQNRLTKSMEKLPKQIIYDIDVEALNKKYGEGNWRIAHWHRHSTLEKIDAPFFERVIYTPTISEGLEHKLHTEPYENALIDRSVVSAPIMADILYRKFVLSLPFNRQAVDYQMQGIDLSKQTIIKFKR